MRRLARGIAVEASGKETLFVPAVIDPPVTKAAGAEPTSGSKRLPRPRKKKGVRDAGVIELEIDGIAMRVGRDDRPWQGGDPPGVAYVYAPDRKAERPIAHIEGFHGILQVDGYGGYRVPADKSYVTLALPAREARPQPETPRQEAEKARERSEQRKKAAKDRIRQAEEQNRKTQR